MGYSPAPPKTLEVGNPYFSDLQKDYVYKANITVFKNRFGGILVIKKTNDDTHRVAFTTEMGNTIFDFSIGEHSFKVNRILKEMDRKMLLHILEQDFRSLIKEHVSPLESFQYQDSMLVRTKIDNKTHYYHFERDALKSVIRTGNQKEKVVIAFLEIENKQARHIQILHKNIKLTISLRAIK